MTALHRALALLLLALAGCSATSPANDGGGRPAGLFAEPGELAFTCVTPGCDTTITTRVTVSGDRRVAIKRVVLSTDAGADWTITPSEKAPFIVGAGAGFDIDVRYLPQGAPSPGSVNLLVTFTDASADDSDPNRLPPGELAIPLVRRLVGQPMLALSPAKVSFGVVRTGQTKTETVTASNVGYGNIALEVTGIDAGVATVSVSLPTPATMTPDASISLPLTWKPGNDEYLKTQLQVVTSTSGATTQYVTLEGTSLAWSRIALEPDDLIDFGEISPGQVRSVPVQVVNQGGVDLLISKVTMEDAGTNLDVTFGTDGGTTLTVPPLGRVPLSLDFHGRVPGELDTKVTFTTNDPQNPQKTLSVRGTVIQPELTLTPTSIDGGTVPMGWVVTNSVELRNTGYGTLTVKNITFVAGSSTLYSVSNKPALPLKLKRDQRAAVDVQFRAETQGPWQASLSVETDDPVQPFREVQFSANVGSCNDGCPIANGTPSCSAGVCAVGMCNAGWYDTDQQASTGCECHEPVSDPGEFCADAVDLGSFSDHGSSSNYTGIIPTAADVDLVRFFADDTFMVFSDSYDVKVRLESGDPGISFCVYRTDTANHQSDCFFSNEVCPTNRSFEKNSSGASDDSADYVIKVFRTASSTATCTPYTLFVSNG
jgi:hypothetical protein